MISGFGDMFNSYFEFYGSITETNRVLTSLVLHTHMRLKTLLPPISKSQTDIVKHIHVSIKRAHQNLGENNYMLNNPYKYIGKSEKASDNLCFYEKICEIIDQ